MNSGCCKDIYFEASDKDRHRSEPFRGRREDPASSLARLPPSTLPNSNQQDRNETVSSPFALKSTALNLNQQSRNKTVSSPSALKSTALDLNQQGRNKTVSSPFALKSASEEPQPFLGSVMEFLNSLSKKEDEQDNVPVRSYTSSEVSPPRQIPRHLEHEPPFKELLPQILSHVADEPASGSEMDLAMPVFDIEHTITTWKVTTVLYGAGVFLTFGALWAFPRLWKAASDEAALYSCVAILTVFCYTVAGLTLQRRISGIRLRLKYAPASLEFGFISNRPDSKEEPFEAQVLSLTSLPAKIWNAALWLMDPPQSGHIRISFRCACDQFVWADYPLEQAEGAVKLQGELRTFFSGLNVDSRSAPKENFFDKLKAVPGRIEFVLQALKDFFSRNPRSRSSDSEAQQRARAGSGTHAKTDFYLTCCRQWGGCIPLLFQLPSTRIDNDSDYFCELRAISKNVQRCWTRWLTPRRIVEIKYVQFQLLFNEKYVDILQCEGPTFPPSMHQYRPFDTQLQGPRQHIGSNILVHFLENEHECREYPHVLPRIPRRLETKLTVQENGEPEIAWGMHLIDRLDHWRAFWNGLVALLACVPPGFAWFISHNHDIQGGTGITACLMGFVLYTFGAWRMFAG